MFRPFLAFLAFLLPASAMAQSPYGTPSASSAGQYPRISLAAEPALAWRDLELRITGPAGRALLIASATPSVPTSFLGVQLHVALAQPMLLPFDLPAAGCTMRFALPASALHAQVIVATDRGLCASTGYELRVLENAPHRNPWNVGSAIGTNLTAVYDWTPCLPFIDYWKTSREWVSGTLALWSDGRTLDLDEHGEVRSLLPGQVARSLMFTDLNGRYTGGRFIVRYDGVGELRYSGAATLRSAQPGRQIVDIDAARGNVGVVLVATEPGNPLRNIRMTREQDEGSEESFAPEFLALTRNYSTLRFMDWQRTNNSKTTSWADRPRVEDARWSSARGVPLEIMVALANRLDADPWFCIPHLADDDYVRNFATLVRDLVEPGRKVYVEYSNETWNFDFEQARELRQRGIALGLNSDPFRAQLFYHSLRSIQIFRIFVEVFEGGDRLVRVLAFQSGNPWTGIQIADYRNAYQEADAIAGAPYFGPIVTATNSTEIMAMNVEQLLDYQANIVIPGLRASNDANAANARARGLDYIAYEGGQNLVGALGLENNAALTDLLIAANRHPRMAALYQHYLSDWRRAGGKLFVNFSDISLPSKWGSWGSLEWRDQDPTTAPKFLAVQSFLRTAKQWW